MKTIEFKWDNSIGGYDAYEKGKINKGADGVYVLASEAEAEIAQLRKALSDSTKAVLRLFEGVS